jgi:hypothetical protein
MSDGQEVKCQICGAVIGNVVVIEDIEFLKIGNLLVRHINSVCLICGEPYYRSVSDKQLEKVYKFHFGFIKVEKT